jgi:hypothetical protein
VEALERGAHYSRVHYTWEQQDTNGVWHARSSQYTQLENGLNRVDANGQWVPVTNALTITTNGAEYVGAEFSLVFRATPEAADAMVLVLADGTRMVSHVAGIAYFDKNSGDSVLLAQVLPVQGQLTSDQTVTYPSCFSDGVDADLVLQVGRSSLAQDVVLHTALAPPSAYGLSDDSEMELLTEWVEAPDPIADAGNTNGPNAAQDLMDFGPLFKIGMGKAFDLSAGEDSGLSVQKYWQTFTDTNGVSRRFLVEALNYADAQPWLGALPQPAGGGAMLLKPDRVLRHQASARPLPSQPKRFEQANLSKGAADGILAKNEARVAGGKKSGFLWDYQATLGSSISNLVCQADTTYYISGLTTVSGTLVYEGGTVLKFADSASTTVKMVLASASSSQVVCNAGMYRVIFALGKDDDLIGEIVSGSSGNPNLTYYANPVLSFDASSSTNGLNLSNFLVREARLGFEFIHNGTSGTGHTFRHGQFAQCNKCIRANASSVKIRNGLFYSTAATVFDQVSTATVDAQNITANTATVLTTGGTLNLTNAILYAVTTVSSGSTYNPGSGNVQSPSSSPFDGSSDIGGQCYLSSPTTMTNGTTSIDSTLLADLKVRTVFAPTFYADPTTNWPPAIARDTTGTTLGYHYDAADIHANDLVISPGINKTIPAGYVVLGDGGNAFWNTGGTLISGGTPTSRVWMAHSESVQEWVGAAGNTYPLLFPAGDASNHPVIQLRFCSFSVPSGGLFVTNDPYASVIRFDDCEVYGGTFLDNSGVDASTQRTDTLRNNLFFRTTINLDDAGSSMPVNAQNNTFSECILSLSPSTNYLWTWRNNLFDQSTITQNAVRLLDGFNGYITNGTPTTLFPSAGTDITLTNSPFQSGTLGSYYLNQSSALVNAGSSPADVAGYFFYTTDTGQSLEGQTRLDIGYHYVALSSGAPVVSNGGSGYLNDPTGFYYLNSQASSAGTGPSQGFSVFITHPVNGQNRP